MGSRVEQDSNALEDCHYGPFTIVCFREGQRSRAVENLEIKVNTIRVTLLPTHTPRRRLRVVSGGGSARTATLGWRHLLGRAPPSLDIQRRLLGVPLSPLLAPWRSYEGIDEALDWSDSCRALTMYL